MMALLAGSKLAAHTLQLTEGSRRLLPEIFPGVEHISYFNLRTDAATQLLLDTGHHLGAVAVPYALAVHEDFVMTVLDLLGRLGRTKRAPGSNADPTKNRITAWNMHEAVWMTLGQPVPAKGDIVALEHFHLLREMRNTHIHEGGTVSARLSDEVGRLSQAAATRWATIARQPPADICSVPTLRFTTFHIFAAFATTKSMGRVVNELLRDGLTKVEWANICLEDYAAQTSKTRGSDQWMRSLIGLAEVGYAAASIGEQDMIDAASAAGAWPAGRPLIQRRSERNAKPH